MVLIPVTATRTQFRQPAGNGGVRSWLLLPTLPSSGAKCKGSPRGKGKRQSGEHIQQVPRPRRASVAGLLHLLGSKGTGASSERKLLVGAVRGQREDTVDRLRLGSLQKNDTEEPHPLLSAAPSQGAVTQSLHSRVQDGFGDCLTLIVWLRIQVFSGSVPDFLSL